MYIQVFDEQGHKFIIQNAVDYKEILEKIPGFKYDRRGGCTIPATFEALKILDNPSSGPVQYSEYAKTVRERVYELHTRAEKAVGIKESKFTDIAYIPETDMFNHQKTAVAWSMYHDRFALFMEQGTGKTKTIIDIVRAKGFGTIEQPVLLVVLNTLLQTGQPVKEIVGHGGWQESEVGVLKGSKDQRLKVLSKPYSWYVVNYDMIPILQRELIDKKFTMIILDESTVIKNRTAKVSKACHLLGKNCKYKAILTGTPITNTVGDIYSQFAFLGNDLLGYPTYQAFRERYIETRLNPKLGFIEEVGTLNKEELIAKLDKFSYRVTKDECEDVPKIPPKQYEVIKVKLTDEELQKYKQFREDAVFRWNEEHVLSVPHKLTLLLRLAQFTGGWIPKSDEDKTMIQVSSSKLLKLEELVDTILSDGGKIIVWARFLPEIHELNSLMFRKGIKHVTIYGEITGADRKHAVDTFEQDPGVRVMVAKTQTAGVGLTMVAADHMIYYSNDYSSEARWQSEDRAHRIGQTKQLKIIDLVAEHTIDELILRAIKNKKSLAREIVDSKLKIEELI